MAWWNWVFLIVAGGAVLVIGAEVLVALRQLIMKRLELRHHNKIMKKDRS